MKSRIRAVTCAYYFVVMRNKSLNMPFSRCFSVRAVGVNSESAASDAEL